MREIIIGIVIILILGNCSGQTAIEKDSFDYDQTFEYEIPESKVAFVLPKSYSKKTISEYKEMMNNSHLSNEIKDNQMNVLNNIKNKFPNFDLLIDTITLEDLIWIIRTGPHVELNKESAQLAVQIYTQNNPKNDLIVQKEKLIEKKLISMNWYKYIKLKVKQDYFQGERYLTHYLISTNKKTFGISFMSNSGKDFQEYVNKIKSLN